MLFILMLAVSLNKVTMRKFILTITYLTITLSVLGQTSVPRKSFDKLSTIKIKKYDEATVTLDNATSIIYNSTFIEIKQKPKSFILEDFECEANSIILADVLLDSKSQKRALLTFDVCPEYEFNLYDLETKKVIATFYALNIIVSGNGAIYTSGHLNEFNLRRKYTYDGKTFKEDKQPFFYIGLKSVTLKEVKLFSDKELTTPLAVLSAGYEIEVLLAEQPFDNKVYLVRTSFGLTGWAALKAEQYKSIDIEGLFYNND
jgi:hypothetical protein